MYYEKSMYITIGSISAAILNLVLNFIFIRLFGYKAAAYTTLLSYAVLSLFHYVMYKKACMINGVKKEIFDIKRMFYISLFLILVSILITLIYDLIFVRYFLLIVLLFILFYSRKKIINMLDVFKKGEK